MTSNIRALRLAAIIMLIASNAHAIDCEQFLRMHGLASRAQFQCGFNRYNNEIIEQARSCHAHLSEARVKENLMKGMQLFDENVRRTSKREACEKVLRTLPMVVGR